MKTTKSFRTALLTGAVFLFPGADVREAAAQDSLPEVTVVQQQQRAVPRSVRRGKSAPSRQRVARPARPKAPVAVVATAVAGPPVEAPVEASVAAGDGPGAELETLTPINTFAMLPSDLQNFAGSGDRVSDVEIDEFRPVSAQEALARVPGVITVNDDGFGRHSGIGIRGAPVRRSRKVLIMEDGQSINYSSYIDPSTHYTPPVDRVEAIEVLKGSVISYGPLNNYGVVNFRNLSPFGVPETVASGAVGNKDSNMRHFHHRAQSGNFGYVFAYSGLDADGAFDTERLRYNDYYGALGWQGKNQDMTVSSGYFRQRDNFDEDNFTTEEFQQFGRCKSCVKPGAIFNNFNADHYRLQVAHNLYIDPTTTISSKVYGQYVDRPRFEAEGDPANPQEVFDDDGNPDGFDGFMEGRDRLYRYYGAESRIQLANRPFLWGMTQDIQAGVRYEKHKFDNRNRIGEVGEILNFDNRGELNDLFERYEADTGAVYAQTAINITPKLAVIPGILFEIFDLDRVTEINGGADDTVEFPVREGFDEQHPLPGVAYSYRMTDKINFYGSYHRGFTPHVARGEAFPLPQELGNNYSAGLRTTAIKGVTFDAAVFHSNVKEFQIKESVTDDLGNNIFNSVDVEIDGVELYGRLDTAPNTGWALNLYGEGVYTYADNIIVDGVDLDEDTGEVLASLNGNEVPENPKEFANLTLGVEHKSGWDASITWTYRGAFFTDVQNTRVDPEGEGEVGIVDDVWLISARANTPSRAPTQRCSSTVSISRMSSTSRTARTASSPDRDAPCWAA